jgi:hypothetical protein
MVVSLMIVWPCMLRVGDEWSPPGSEECEFKFGDILCREHYFLLACYPAF